ncbi:MAG: biopolymer transporter ExbD [Deltaproteobacteria bacterium]|nr:biopolymer transporter ExbD [Deltaproteobacteria bacterium]
MSLNLTALMDILSNLLFFLLASYTTQELEVKTKTRVDLPSSTSELSPAKDLVVTVSTGEIQVAGTTVLHVKDSQVQGSPVEGEKIVALFQRLHELRKGNTPPGTILLMADRSIDTELITKVLKTAGMAGFPNARFGVLAR